MLTEMAALDVDNNRIRATYAGGANVLNRADDKICAQNIAQVECLLKQKGVPVAGCHIGDCHYLKGNYMTIKRVAILQELMKFTGLQEERLLLNWVSAAEGVRFAEMVRTFTDKIKELGPSHLKTTY